MLDRSMKPHGFVCFSNRVISWLIEEERHIDWAPSIQDALCTSLFQVPRDSQNQQKGSEEHWQKVWAESVYPLRTFGGTGFRCFSQKFDPHTDCNVRVSYLLRQLLMSADTENTPFVHAALAALAVFFLEASSACRSVMLMSEASGEMD